MLCRSFSFSLSFCSYFSYRWVSAALRQTLTRASVANMSEDKL